MNLLLLLLIVLALICFGMAASGRPTKGWNPEPAGFVLLTLALLIYVFAGHLTGGIKFPI